MKKPTLRFRQVFEHPTHFKVTRPLGNPIKIAKQGLSPNLMGRLRKFAEGGETPEPTQQDQDNFNEMQAALREMAKAAPEPREDVLSATRGEAATGEGLGPEMFSSRVEPTIPQSFRSSVMQDAARIEDQAERAQFIKDRIDEYRAAEMFSTPRGVAATGEGLTTPERITKPTKLPSEIVPSGVFTQSAKPEDVITKPDEEEVPTKARPRPVRPGVTAEAAEPTAETVAAKAPAAAAEKPAVVEPAKPVEPVKVDPLDEALGALNLTRESLKTMTPLQQSAALSSAQMIMAGKAATQAQMVAADANIQALKEQGDAERTALKKMEGRAREARETQRKILEEMEYLKNPGSYMSRLSTLGQIGTAISLAAGAFASGMTGMPNFAQKIFDNAIEEDLAEQKRRSDSLYQRLVAAGHSVEGAEDMVRAQLKLVGAAEQGRKAATIKLPEAKAKLLEQQAKTVNDAIQTMVRVGKEERLATAAAEKAPLEKQLLEARVATELLEPKRINAAIRQHDQQLTDAREEREARREERIAAAKEKARKDAIARELNIGDAVLELKDDTRAPNIRDNIAQREQGIMAAMKLDSLLKESGLEVFDPRSNKRGEAIAELATLVEIFPKLEGFSRAISVSAKTQLEKGLQDPTGWKAMLKQIFLDRDPAVGVRAILEEGKRSYANQVKSQIVNPKDPKVEAAIQSFYTNAKKDIERYKTSTADTESLFEE